MNPEIVKWQNEAGSAFTWLVELYRQSQVLLDDAQALFGDESWEVRYNGGWGGAAMSNWDLQNWPFIYVKALAACPTAGDWDATPGRAAFFGILFHGAQGLQRTGPRYFGAVASWTNSKVPCDHWMLYDALDTFDEKKKRFGIDGPGPIRIARPPSDNTRYRGLSEVRWFDVPLGAIRSAEALKIAVQATMSLYRGKDDEVLTALHGVLDAR